MGLKNKTFQSMEQVREHIKLGTPSFYFASQTSTVIPYQKLEQVFSGKGSEDFCICDLSTVPGEMKFLENGHLEVSGAATWKDAKEFCLANNRNILTSPTEELASVLSGVATSATGERSFGFGTLREQIVSLEYLDYKGELRVLDSSKTLNQNLDLEVYQKSYAPYEKFKNAPFPRFMNETDLLTGTEGQLGVITKAVLKTSPHLDISYIFLHLPKWEDNFEPHLELFEKVQNYRDKVFSCELIDENSLSVLDSEDRPVEGKDIIFLEIEAQHFEFLYENFLSKLDLIDEESIFEITPSKCRELRMMIPRLTFEKNTRMGVTKKGTDVQVTPEHFRDLLGFYRELSQKGVAYNLFGHFGDAHLHFNFMPTKDEEDICQEYLHHLYEKVFEWKGSPFAEHGIGLIKQKFIHQFYGPGQLATFKRLKERMDPQNIFFPQGFMSINQ